MRFTRTNSQLTSMFQFHEHQGVQGLQYSQHQEYDHAGFPERGVRLRIRTHGGSNDTEDDGDHHSDAEQMPVLHQA